MWEQAIDINEIHEIRSRAIIYFGLGAITKLPEIFGSKALRDVRKVTVVTDNNAYKLSGAWAEVEPFLQRQGLQYLLFDEVRANPSTTLIDRCIAQSREFGTQAFIAIGGGSVIDTAKISAIMLGYPEASSAQLMQYQFFPEQSAPVVAINLTHGTGSEANHFGVAAIDDKNYKPAVGFEEMYPLYSIDDPNLMASLPLSQTRYVTLDALTHAIEAATGKGTGPFSKTLSVKSADLIFRYFPRILRDLKDSEARYYLAFASMLAGISFDNGTLHLGHALEHPISAMKPNVPHGLGLAVLLPEVLEVIYPAVPEVLDEMLHPILRARAGAGAGTGASADAGASAGIKAGIKQWLAEVGLATTLTDLGFVAEDVVTLTDLVYATPGIPYMLDSTPVAVTPEIVARIYRNSL